MRYCFTLILMLSSVFGQNLIGQTKLDSTIQYSYLHFRLGNSIFREVNFGFNPMLRFQKKFYLGIGYRYNTIISSSCFLERGIINGNLHGPVFSIGYDGTNRKHPKPINLTLQIAYKYLKSDTIKYIEAPCLLGEVHDDADYKIYWHSANVVGAKVFMDGNFAVKTVGFYLGLGVDFQLLTKHFIESGSFGQHWPDNDVEKILYLIPKIDLGLRFNASKKF